MASGRDTAGGGGLRCEDSLSKRMWLKFHRETVFSIYTPFLVGLASGTLTIHSFRHFISQDSHFLNIFSRSYELAGECADDDDVKVVISSLRKNVLEELKVHDSFIEEWGSELVKECPPNPTTTKYTNFLLATASGNIEGLKDPGKLATPFEKTKIAAYIISAMTPCMRLYAFIAKELITLQNSIENNNPYKRWIDHYASKNFQESTLQIEDLLDKLSVSLTGEELDILENLYHHSMKLELELFSVQPFCGRSLVPFIKEDSLTEENITIFSDFDLTCTVIDSSAVLAEIAIITAQKSDRSEGEASCLSAADMKNTWGALSKKYTQEYEQCIESIMSTEKLDKFNYSTLKEAVEKVSDFERMANSRVIDSGVLKGLNVGDIKRAGERLILQDGCVSFFQSLVKHESVRTNIHVLSYCWCDDLIKSSFSAGLAIYDTMQYIRSPINTICLGQAASMASLLLASGAKGKRQSLPNATVMVHQPSGGISGDASNMSIHTKQINRIWDTLNLLYSKHTGQGLDAIKKIMDRDYFMTPQEAKEFGLIDEVIDQRPVNLVSDAIVGGGSNGDKGQSS